MTSDRVRVRVSKFLCDHLGIKHRVRVRVSVGVGNGNGVGV